MTTHEIKQLTRQAFDQVWNEGNLDILDDLMQDDDVFHVASWGEVRGPDGFRDFVSAFRSAFPDFRITIEDQIAEGDQVATRWTWRGTHRGEFRGVEPTNERVTVTGITMGRVSDEKRGESWIEADVFGLYRQLGAIPEHVGARA